MAFHLTDDGIQFHTILETETFQVIIILFGIEENRRPNLIGLELFKNDISFVIMIIQIKIGRMVSTILIYNQNPVLSLEFSRLSVFKRNTSSSSQILHPPKVDTPFCTTLILWTSFFVSVFP